MTRARSTDGDLDVLGVLITAAFGLDREWVDDARCLRYENPLPDGPTPWQFDPKQRWRIVNGGKQTVIHGEEMVRVALSFCWGCPVQWECASYAVRGRMIAGTWAMTEKDLGWLAKRDDAQEIIDESRMAGVPLQVRVPQLRAADA